MPMQYQYNKRDLCSCNYFEKKKKEFGEYKVDF